MNTLLRKAAERGSSLILDLPWDVGVLPKAWLERYAVGVPVKAAECLLEYNKAVLNAAADAVVGVAVRTSPLAASDVLAAYVCGELMRTASSLGLEAWLDVSLPPQALGSLNPDHTDMVTVDPYPGFAETVAALSEPAEGFSLWIELTGRGSAEYLPLADGEPMYARLLKLLAAMPRPTEFGLISAAADEEEAQRIRAALPDAPVMLAAIPEKEILKTLTGNHPERVFLRTGSLAWEAPVWRSPENFATSVREECLLLRDRWEDALADDHGKDGTSFESAESV